VKKVISDGRLCLSLGGDHSMGVGTIDGHMQAKGELSVLWVDAHADINTNTTSQSGNVHGMPVALLAKELSDYWPYLPGLDWQVPRSHFFAHPILRPGSHFSFAGSQLKTWHTSD
jgi:arginase